MTRCSRADAGAWFNYTFLTSKERDIETGLDYFEARYLSSTQGRFTSVDPMMRSASIETPQSFNRYSYVLNSPTNDTDPTGMCPKGQKCYYEKDEKGRDVEYYDDKDGNPVLVTDTNVDKQKPIVAGPVITAPPEITYHFRYKLIPRQAPAAATNRAGISIIGELFGALGMILLNPTKLGCGDEPGGHSDGQGGCTQSPTMSDEPDTSANPDPEDNKPDTSENDDKKEKSKEARENYRPLSRKDIKELQDRGYDIHEMKEGMGRPSHFDLYKDRNGDVYVMRKGGRGEAQPTGVKLH